MALGDVTRDAVLAAVAEFDDLTRDVFLEEHGFGRARSYFLEYQGKLYDSKAIVGVAHGIATGQAWSAEDFSGGDETVRRCLEGLGFAVIFSPTDGSVDRGRRGLEARDYLDLDLESAREQWRAIESRAPVSEGRRGNFVPVETLLCLAASLLVHHRRYGGSTAHLAEEPVQSLARLFRRPPSSILAKMANLDGSRPHGGKHEIEVAARLLASLNELAAKYRLIVGAAREVGIGADRLPDFLNIDDEAGELTLLGQDELAAVDIERVVAAEASRWHAVRSDLEDVVTERLLVAAARIGQHRFAAGVLRNHAHQCVFCGFTVHINGLRAPQMLVASHIKPWRDSAPSERLDFLNGLAACPTHDAAFDTGLITVDADLSIRVLPELAELARNDTSVHAAFGQPPLAERLLLPAGAVAPRPGYLDWHHRHVYRGRRANESSGA